MTKGINFQEALEIIKRDLEIIKNPRVLELILEVLGYNLEVREIK